MGDYSGGHHCAIQYATNAPHCIRRSPHWGGLSGCTFEEAQSWGKINRDATKSVAYVEASIGLSLMVGYILQKGLWKKRKRLQYDWEGDTLKSLKQKTLKL